jgi:hypothetical protein
VVGVFHGVSKLCIDRNQRFRDLHNCPKERLASAVAQYLVLFNRVG